MLGHKTSRMYISILFVLGVVFIVAGVVLFFFSDRIGPAPDRHVPAGLSQSSADEINAYCRENQDVIERMPQDPRTQEVLDRLVAIWCKDTGLERHAALEGMVTAFKNSPLGLAALDSCLTTGAERASAFCSSLVEQYPDSRVACMALDRQINGAPDQAARLLDDAIRSAPDSRVAVFALVRKGDRAKDAGDMHQAARCWLEAWLKDPQRAKMVFSGLCLFWIQTGDWDYPLVMSSEYIEDPVLNPIKERALAALEESGSQPGTGRTLVRETGRALEKGDIVSAVSSLQQLIGSPGSLTPEDRACLGTAVFLLGSDKNYALTVDLKQSLEMRGKLSRCREQFLAWGQEAYPSVPPDVRAMFAVLLAARWLQDAQVKPAVDLLQAAWRDTTASTPWRERALQRMADVLVEERSDYRGAGQAFVEYCDGAEKPRPNLRLRAATLFNRAGQYDRSLEQLDKLEPIADSDDLKAAAVFLRALDCMGKGDNIQAVGLLDAFPDKYPRSDLAPQALDIMARTAMAKADHAEAARCYQEIVDKYPQSSSAGTAQQELARLQGRSDGAGPK